MPIPTYWVSAIFFTDLGCFDDLMMNKFQLELKKSLPDLWRYAFALSRDRTNADDIVQDCAERAVRKRDQWQRDRPIKPWLMTILLNIYRNQYRRDTYLRLVPIDDDQSKLHERLPAPSSEQDRIELAATAHAINQLPPEQREALLTVVVGGLDYGEAAKTLDIPRGTVMSRISRARARLRQIRALENGSVRRIK